jgi:outer membrane protein
MIRLLWLLLPIVGLLIQTPFVHAQVAKIGIVDFEKALVDSAEGKKSSDKFNATVQNKQSDGQKRQQELEDAQKKYQTQERTLSETAKANLQKDIDRRTTELQRFNEDSQKELQSLRDELLRPIAEKASAILNQLAAERGYTVVVDISNPQNNVVWFNPANDITAELTRRIDAATKTSEAKPAPAPSNARPLSPAPAAPRPAAPLAPRPTAPAPK